ncbi:MAG: RNA 2',3'-cyclic phosphodiesterase, partial [Thermoproteota archaeon]
MRIRGFIAIDVEDAGIVSKISEIQETLVASKARLKRVETENLHFTLKFLGEVEEERLELVKSTMNDVLENFNPFSMHLYG